MIVLLWVLGNFERGGVERELGGRWEGGREENKQQNLICNQFHFSACSIFGQVQLRQFV